MDDSQLRVAVGRGALPALLLLAAACARLEPLDCGGAALPAISVEVRSAATGEALAERAIVRVKDGTYEDTLPLCGRDAEGRWLRRCGAVERAGRYVVSVDRAGYQTWQTGVVVEREGCHVRTVVIPAQLADPAIRLALPVGWVGEELVLTSGAFVGPDTQPLIQVGGIGAATRYIPPDTLRLSAPNAAGTYAITVGLGGREAFTVGRITLGGGFRSTLTIGPAGGAPLAWPGGGRATFLVTMDSGLALVDPVAASITRLLPDSAQDGNCVYGPGPAVGGGIVTSGRLGPSSCGSFAARFEGDGWAAADSAPTVTTAYGADVRFAARLGPGHWLRSGHHYTWAYLRDSTGTWQSAPFWTDEPKDIVVSPRGDRVVVRGSNWFDGAPVFEPGRLQPVYVIPPRLGAIRGAAFTDDGDSLYVLGEDNPGAQTIAILAATDGRVLREVPLPQRPPDWSGGLVLDPNGRWMYLIGTTLCPGGGPTGCSAVGVYDRRKLAPVAVMAGPSRPLFGNAYPFLAGAERRLFVAYSCTFCTAPGSSVPVMAFDLLP